MLRKKNNARSAGDNNLSIAKVLLNKNFKILFKKCLKINLI